MNPMALLRIKPKLHQFKESHPKFPMFFRAAADAADEGSVLEISLVTSSGKNLVTNMKMTDNDVELISEIRKLLADSVAEQQ